MRLKTCLLVSGILSGVSAASPSASFFAFESPNPSSSNPQTVSPEVARLILARRLGLSQFHRLKGLDDGTLQQVNDLGGAQRPLLGGTEGSRRESSMVIIVEGVGNTADVIPSLEMSPSFFISDPPGSSANRLLLSDLVAQARSSHVLPEVHLDFMASGNTLMGSITIDENTPLEVQGECKAKLLHTYEELSVSRGGHLEADELRLLKGLVTSRCGTSKSMIHFTLLEKLAKGEGISSAAYRDAVIAVRKILSGLADSSKEDGRIVSVLLMPLNLRNVKRSDWPYGSYSSPAARSAVPQQGEHEVLLSGTAEPPRAPSSQIPKALPVLRGTIPLCHISVDECNTETRNCSGRGTCARRHSRVGSSHPGNGQDGGAGRICYTCLNCKADVSDDGKKTTYWGGAACQKQDVSVPFFLLAGFTVVLVGAVAWGIGLLYSIGQEELPGVLAAGVAVSRPR